eukprot:399018_1
MAQTRHEHNVKQYLDPDLFVFLTFHTGVEHLNHPFPIPISGVVSHVDSHHTKVVLRIHCHQINKHVGWNIQKRHIRINNHTPKRLSLSIIRA